jgi:hypothetical protein
MPQGREVCGLNAVNQPLSLPINSFSDSNSQKQSVANSYSNSAQPRGPQGCTSLDCSKIFKDL